MVKICCQRVRKDWDEMGSGGGGGEAKMEERDMERHREIDRQKERGSGREI